MVYTFPELFQYLNQWGIADVLLPFILFFVVLFATMQKIELLGKPNEDGRKYHLLVALALSLLVVIPHVTGLYGQLDIIPLINSILPQVVFIMIAILLLMTLLGFTGHKKIPSPLLSLIAFLAILIVLYIIYQTINPTINLQFPWLGWLSDPSFQALIVVLLVFGVIVWYITSPPSAPGGKRFGEKTKDFFEDIGKLLGGG
ncbi:hypothetical protein HY642_01535 [Candidatus Woesearchaeota archaeon]|nr:hypothetical protein [Candidatus Woesearchaeota archaeon]